MLFWILLASLVPADRKAQLAAAIGCGLYFELALAESMPPAEPVDGVPQA